MNLTEIVQKNKEALKIIYASNNIAQEVNEATLGMLLVSNDKVASEVSALLSSPPESFESVEGKDKEKVKEVAKVVLDTINANKEKKKKEEEEKKKKASEILGMQKPIFFSLLVIVLLIITLLIVKYA